MTYKALLFDMNGVLVDDEPVQEQAFRNVLASIDVALSATDFIRYFIGKTDAEGLRDYVRDYALKIDEKQIIRLKQSEYKRLIDGSVKGYKGSIECITRALERGLKIAIVTGSPRGEAETNLLSLNLLQYFHVIVSGDDIVNGKPDPEGYLKGANLLGIDPQECIVIEDAPSGLTAANAVGMMSVALLTSHTKTQLQRADKIVAELSANLVDELLQLDRLAE